MIKHYCDVCDAFIPEEKVLFYILDESRLSYDATKDLDRGAADTLCICPNCMNHIYSYGRTHDTIKK